MSDEDSQSVVVLDLANDLIKFHETLGKGGFATIYRCTVKGFSFACKCIDTEFLAEKDLEPIKKEISIMKGLSHSNIVKYLGSEVDPLQVKIFLELYKDTLHGIIQSRAPNQNFFTAEELSWFCLQICQGLQYLHNYKPFPIIHRDLKCENIFYVENKNSLPLLKIGDLGEAKMLATDVTHTINEFRAPEIYGLMTSQELKGHNEKADIWSFGMVLFELLTFDIPYRANVDRFSLPEYIEKGIRPTFPHTVAKDTNLEPLFKIFNMCTEKEPSKRPSAKSLVKKFQKLHNLLKRSSVSTVPILPRARSNSLPTNSLAIIK